MKQLEELLLGKRPEEMTDEELEAAIIANRAARRNIMETKRASSKSKPASISDSKQAILDSTNSTVQAELFAALAAMLGDDDA